MLTENRAAISSRVLSWALHAAATRSLRSIE